MRAVLITNHPAPYRQLLYTELAARLPDLAVLYEARTSSLRGWGSMVLPTYETEFLADEGIESLTGRARGLAVSRALRRRKPDLVFAPGFGAAALASLAWCRTQRRACIGVSGATLAADRRVRGSRLALRRVIARAAHGWVAYGPEAARYLEWLGAAPDRVVPAGNPYGLEPRQPRAERPLAEELRLGVIGQLHWRKGWWIPVKAAAVAARRGVPVSVTVVGDGPGSRLLERMLEEEQVAVRWRRRVPPEEIETVYDKLDLLAVPSLLDQWPIVASEAAAMGVPAVCTPERESGLPEQMSTANEGRPHRAGAIDPLARLVERLRDRAAYEAALDRVAAARRELSPAAVAERWVAHVARLPGRAGPPASGRGLSAIGG